MKLVLIMIILKITFLLAGCSTKYVPVKTEIPKLPIELNKPCQELELVQPNETKLSNVVKVVSTNYGKYHECKALHQSTLDWINNIKQ